MERLELRTLPTSAIVGVDPGNSQAEAFGVGTLSNRTVILRDTVSTETDIRDVVQFSLARDATVTISLKGLRNNVHVGLLDSAYSLLTASENPGRKSERIRTVLSAGTYYASVLAIEGSSSFTLTIAARNLRHSTGGNGNPGGNPGNGNDNGNGGGGGGDPLAGTIPVQLTDYNLLVLETTYAGDTNFPTNLTTYTPIQTLQHAGLLRISPSVGNNVRQVALIVASDPLTNPTAGAIAFSTENRTLELATVSANNAGDTLEVVQTTAPFQAPLGINNNFNIRSGLTAGVYRVHTAVIRMQFLNGGQTLQGEFDMVGVGIIEPGTYRVSGSFTGSVA